MDSQMNTLLLCFILCFAFTSAQELNLCFSVGSDAGSTCSYDGYEFAFHIPNNVGQSIRRAAIRNFNNIEKELYSAFVQFAQVDPILPNEISFRAGLALNLDDQVALMVGEDDFLIGIPANWLYKRARNKTPAASVVYADFENSEEICTVTYKDCQEFRTFTINLAASA